MLPVLQVGPLALQFPGLLVILGIWLGLTLAERNAAKFDIADSHLYNLVFLNMLAGLVGARLTFIATHFYAFQGNLLNIFSLNAGLLDWWGCFAFALIASLIYVQRNEIPIWPLLDALTPFLAVIQVFLALSFFASGSYFGKPTSLPWGVELWNQIRHPNQVYYAIAGIGILAILWRIIIPRLQNYHGMTFLLYATLLSFAYMFLSVFDANGTIILNRVRVEPVIYWLLLTASMLLIRFRIRHETDTAKLL